MKLEPAEQCEACLRHSNAHATTASADSLPSRPPFPFVAAQIGTPRCASLGQAALPNAQSVLSFERADFGGLEVGKPVPAEADQTYLLVSEGGLRAFEFNGSDVSPVKP